jgi:hypothetical protein
MTTETNYESMFKAAVMDLAEVSVALGLPDQVTLTTNGNVAILAAIAELQQRLYDCENAVLLRHDAAVASYYTKYPTPIDKPAS